MIFGTKKRKRKKKVRRFSDFIEASRQNKSGLTWSYSVEQTQQPTPGAGGAGNRRHRGPALAARAPGAARDVRRQRRLERAERVLVRAYVFLTPS